MAPTVLLAPGQRWPCRLRPRLSGPWCHGEHLVLSQTQSPLLGRVQTQQSCSSALLNFMEIDTLQLLETALLLPLLKPVDSAAFHASLQERLGFAEGVEQLRTRRSRCHPGHGLELGTGRVGGVTWGWQRVLRTPRCPIPGQEFSSIQAYSPLRSQLGSTDGRVRCLLPPHPHEGCRWPRPAQL